jgi:hypothetical protein
VQSWSATLITSIDFTNDDSFIIFTGSHSGILATGESVPWDPPVESVPKPKWPQLPPDWLMSGASAEWLAVDGHAYHVKSDGSLDIAEGNIASGGEYLSSIRIMNRGHNLVARLCGREIVYSGDARVLSVATEPRNQVVVLGLEDRRLLSATASGEFEELRVENESLDVTVTPTSLLFSASGERLYVGGEVIWVLSWPTLAIEGAMMGHMHQRVTAIAESSNGALVAAASSGLFPMVSVWTVDHDALTPFEIGARTTARLYLTPKNRSEAGDFDSR